MLSKQRDVSNTPKAEIMVFRPDAVIADKPFQQITSSVF